jgi:hypothetical protein
MHRFNEDSSRVVNGIGERCFDAVSVSRLMRVALEL